MSHALHLDRDEKPVGARSPKNIHGRDAGRVFDVGIGGVTRCLADETRVVGMGYVSGRLEGRGRRFGKDIHRVIRYESRRWRSLPGPVPRHGVVRRSAGPKRSLGHWTLEDQPYRRWFRVVLDPVLEHRLRGAQVHDDAPALVYHVRDHRLAGCDPVATPAHCAGRLRHFAGWRCGEYASRIRRDWRGVRKVWALPIFIEWA